MKNGIIILCIALCIGCFTGCGNKDSDKSSEVQLSKEFKLEPVELEGALKMDGILFAKEVTKAKVVSLNPDKKGVSLSYSLGQEDTEKLITLFQKETTEAVETDETDYNSAALRDSYGLRIEFVDSLDRFYTGAARLTCFTTIDENYLGIIDDNGNTKLYKIVLSDEVIEFLNNASAENYKETKGRTGWFNKAFNTK